MFWYAEDVAGMAPCSVSDACPFASFTIHETVPVHGKL
jgi:hypothetical protein